MTRMILDFSSVVGSFNHLKDEEYGEDVDFNGKIYHIPDPLTSLERFQHSLELVLDSCGLKRTDIVAVKDPVGRPTERMKKFPGYKALSVREPQPEEFFTARKKLFEIATEWLKSQGAIIAIPPKGYEADDLINELAIRLESTIVYTRDKDLIACPTNVLYHDRNGIELNPEKFPVKKEHIHTYRTIVTGDTSDKLPSCKGFGPKAWGNMVDKFGYEAVQDLTDMLEDECLEELNDLVDEFKPFKLILDQQQSLYSVYNTMKFMKPPTYKIIWEGGMAIGDKTLVTKDNFEEVFKRLENTEFEYSVIDFETDTCQESKDWAEEAGIKVDVIGSEITGMGLRINDDNFYFCVDHCDTNNISLKQLGYILEFLYNKRVYAHNSTGFENVVLWNHFGGFLPKMWDTRLMASYVDENDLHNLKYLSKKYLDYAQATYEETLNGVSGMKEISGEQVLSYGIDDVITCDALQNLFSIIMEYEGSLKVFEQVEVDSAFFTSLCIVHGVDFDEDKFKELKKENDEKIVELEEELSKKLLAVGWEGGEFRPLRGKNIGEFKRFYNDYYGHPFTGRITAYAAAVRSLEEENLKEILGSSLDEINEFYKTFWKPKAVFNVRSSVQMQRLLYDVLGIPVRIRNKPTEKMKKAGKPGNPAANEDAIENAIAFGDVTGAEKDLLETLLEYKGCLTKESLFFEKYPKFVHWKTGKIHPQLKQTATTTRRFSCSAPNLQQLPKKKGKEVRDMITVPEEWVIAAYDFSGQELRLAAWFSQDPNFLSCYIGDNKKDFHSITGFSVCQKQGGEFESYEDFVKAVKKGLELAKKYRATGKGINFSSQYGCAAPKLANMLRVTEKEGEIFLKAREEAFPVLVKETEKYKDLCQKRKYATTFMGVRRHLHSYKHFSSKDNYVVEKARRLAFSFKIQGSAAEQTKLVMARIWKTGVFNDGLCKPMFTVHDELVVAIWKDVLSERAGIIYDCMVTPYADMEIKPETEPQYGTHFGSLKEFVEYTLEV